MKKGNSTISSKAELERESQKIARRYGVSSKRALELTEGIWKDISQQLKRT